MSRYGVNKALWVVGRDDTQATRYLETPETFLADYSLTPEEHRQLIARDYAGMFADGAHPFLLYTFRIKLAGGFSFPLLIEHVKALSGIEPPLDIST